MYYLKVDFDLDFTDYIMYLKGKYPKKLFDLDGIGDTQTDMCQFSKNFFSTRTTTADVSVDENSNVDDLSVIAYQSELPKPLFRLNSYYVLWKKLKQLYGIQKANQIIESQLIGDIYINDFHGIGGGFSYCFNYSMYDIALQGLPMIKKIKSISPKYLYSFKSQLEQFVVIASNSTLGACGLADIFIVMGLYVDKIFKNGHDAGFFFDGWFSEEEKKLIFDKLVEMPVASPDCLTDTLIFEKTKEINRELNKVSPANEEWFNMNVWKYVKENIVSLIYTINQPMRGNQSPFTNVSIFDDYFLDQMLPGYILDDVTPSKNTVKQLQNLFLNIMNTELERTPITFPVTTACFVIDDDKNIQDEQFLEMIASKNKKFGFINIYCGKSSTLSSCCFKGNEIIEVFNIETNMNEFISIKDFVSLYSNDNIERKIDKKYKILSLNPKTLKTEMVFVSGILKKNNNLNKLVEITIDNKTINVTLDHVFIVKDKNTNEIKEVTAEELIINKDIYLLPVL